MSKPIPSPKKSLATLCLVALTLLPACRQGRGTSEGGQATTVPQNEGAEEQDLGDPLQGYAEGPGLPEGWPVALIPLPPGTVPVASLAHTTVPGTPGESNAVFYSAEQSPKEIHAFLAQELPAKGWKIIDSSPANESDYLITAAEGNGYVGLFGAGVGFGPSQVSSGQKIAIQVILAKVT